MTFIANCLGRAKEEYKLKAGVFSTLSIDKVCDVNEVLLTISHQLLSTEETHNRVSEMFQ